MADWMKGTRKMTASRTTPRSTTASSEQLCSFLADTYSLFVLTQGCHWNVTGAQFVSLHLLFQQQYTELSNAIDEIAERIRSLGLRAPGTLAEIASHARPVTDNVGDANDMLGALTQRHHQLALDAQQLAASFDRVHDGPSVDLMNSRRAAHEKTAWMLTSASP